MPEDRAPTKTARHPAVRRPRALGDLLRLRFAPHARLTDELFAALAAENRDLRLERTARGDLEIMAPAGGGSSNKNGELNYQLVKWSKNEGRGLGVCFDSSCGYILPNTATRGPDASWMTQARWDALTPDERAGFLPLCPDFVAELRSPSDRLTKLRKKMEEYISQGARLGWLIDPLTDTVEVYRPGRPVESKSHPENLSGEDVLPALVVEMKGILFD
jgi:Uma2 family endonuclease